jgi:hypothetical protein
MSEADTTKPKTRDEAIEMVERLQVERYRDHRSAKWFHDQIEALEFFGEDEIWDLMEWYR